MGDIADDCFDRAMDELADLDCGQDYFVYYRSHTPPPATCKLCGATNLKWRIAEGGRWVLVENTRVQPGNFKPDHTCPTSADGFDEV